MDKEALQRELDAAYVKLDSYDRQIKNLLIARRQDQMVFDLLETAGFIADGKLEEARGFAQSFFVGN